MRQTKMNHDTVPTKKPAKRNPLEARTTLDAIHKKHVEQFSDISGELQEITARLDAIHREISVAPADRVFDLQKERESLEKRRARLDKREDLMDYYLQTGDILFEYYAIQEKIATGAGVSSTTKVRPGTIFAALEAAAATEEASAPTPVVKKGVLPSFDREKLLDKYLQIMDPEIAKQSSSEADDNWSECKQCGTEMIFSMNEAYISCPSCGYQDFVLIDSDKPSYKDPPREISYYAYKRINHFNEWLAQFQAKESTEIPQEIFDGILMELKKERITNMASLKLSKLREILRKLKYNKYYEHIPHILNRLNGQTAPVMSRDNEEKLRHMFKEIQPSFQRHCPSDRSNFLSYSYVLYKFCELLELDEFLPCFPLLKNRDKLYAQDKIWEKICADLHWEFYRTL
jgi:DNA-directed RNA polymerase subunit RPC12/RpoP